MRRFTASYPDDTLDHSRKNTTNWHKCVAKGSNSMKALNRLRACKIHI